MLAGIDAIGGFVTGGGASGSFNAAVDYPTISKTSSSRFGDPKTVRTSPVTASASGGLPGYTYAWASLSGSGMVADSAAAASTTFSDLLSPGDSEHDIFRCTVTDSTGSHAPVDVAVTLALVGS